MSDKFVELITNLANSESELDRDRVKELIETSGCRAIDLINECIDVFVRLNVTGPSDQRLEAIVRESDRVRRAVEDDLSCEGELPFKKAKGLIVLWLARSLCEDRRRDCLLSKADVYESCLGFLKCVYLHQTTLPDCRSVSLKTQMVDCYDQACRIKDTNPIDPWTEFQMLVLASHLHLIYYEYRQAEALLDRCKAMLGLSTELKGALGKRTKHQIDNVSQLYLEINRAAPTIDSERINESAEQFSTVNLPNDQMLDDEVLLDEPSFLDETVARDRQQRPTIAEQCLLILQTEQHKLSRAKDSVTEEECAAILGVVLGSNIGRRSTWAVASDALLARCQLGTMSTRRTERALIQLEELANQFEYSSPAAGPRTDLFFLSRLPAIWEVQLKLAHVLKSMGLTKSALDILLPWEQWSPIIDCFIKLGQRERAEKLIRERIDQDGETNELLCCLGDVTQDRSHYQRAWIVSKERSARAMRSLAMHYMFVDNDHEKARDCFESSLRINPLQTNTWFTYGCCCLRICDYRRASGAFKQCVRLEPDNYEAWNNCASALVELGEKKNALVLLKEASKYNYENWRVWDNICIVSADVEEYLTSIKAYHRVMDLRQQHRDPATLSHIVKAVIGGKISNQEEVRGKLKELFARIASKDGRDPRIWMLNGELLSNDEDQSNEMKMRVIQCLSRAHHGMCPSGWEKDKAQCKRGLVSVLRLVEKSFEYDISYASAKLAVKSVKTLLQNHRSSQLEELDEETLSLLEKIDDADTQMADKM